MLVKFAPALAVVFVLMFIAIDVAIAKVFPRVKFDSVVLKVVALSLTIIVFLQVGIGPVDLLRDLLLL
jgi:hypothetical protein